ncbi:MAG: phosphatidylinositol kinase [Alphaproteobacteria bacterium 16-39-46]|nr:MAG: phosphatidylinositol kinase [Alphaproteobacteria bacterium 16-39-46]OZA42347.1 MAG: phosphatidylinositol kinase [Alphaproteobacteria bacterium 17-39-52]HQS84511.1 HipA domain-containing protein [Alphaproteobacteria bacterium]HQS94301.1 HipA domain-containing protein [Alphaproteobacteria bacterium]
MSYEEVIVSISLGNENICVGKLWFHLRGNRESASFEYEKEWLKHPERFALEPALTLTEGAFHNGSGVSIFGAIGDSAPDRWGRVLMRRAEIARAKRENITPKTLCEIDYLLGVNDEARQGALRFSVKPLNTFFLKQNDKGAIPPLISLPKLLSATERFLEDDESSEDLKLLLAPGSSLGGARPKASVFDQDGSLAIAKFSRKDDELNVVLWEAVALTLAKKAGIRVPSWRLEKILNKSVLIIKRFDRENKQRIPFLSAMSMLGAKDNEPHSYLEIAYALAQNGGAPEEDMAELWRRIIFTIMISNTDDHLRNHGFFYERHQGWRLSPVYDVNPTPIDIKPRVLTTSIDFDDTTASLETAMKISKDFRLSKERAREIIKEVAFAVSQWKQVALHLGLSKCECDRMASAFEYEKETI